MDKTQQQKAMDAYHTISNQMGTAQLYNLLEKSINDPQHLLQTLVWESPVINFSKRQYGNKTALDSLTKLLDMHGTTLREMGINVLERNERYSIYLDLEDNTLLADIVKDSYKKSSQVRTLNGVSIPRPIHNEIGIPEVKDLSPEELALFKESQAALRTLSLGS